MTCPAGTPLLRKLGIKPGHRVAFAAAPKGFRDSLGAWPLGASLEGEDGPAAALDLVVFFARSQAEVRERFAALAGRLAPAGALWVAWPKKASGVASDLTEGVVQGIGLDAGLVDNKVCSVDATWSALRFVYRLKDRPPSA
jgi:hypothetical protein